MQARSTPGQVGDRIPRELWVCEYLADTHEQSLKGSSYPLFGY